MLQWCKINFHQVSSFRQNRIVITTAAVGSNILKGNTMEGRTSMLSLFIAVPSK